MVVHCVLATVSRFCEIVNVMADPRRISANVGRSPIRRSPLETQLDTAPEVFLVVVVAVYATVPEQGESAAGRSSQEPGRSRTKCGTCPDARDTCAPTRRPAIASITEPAPRATPPAAVLVADVPSEPGPLDTIVIGQQVPGGGTHTVQSRDVT